VNADVKQFLDELFAISRLNRLPENYGGGLIFDAPVIGVAQGGDPIFTQFNLNYAELDRIVLIESRERNRSD
jgi:hypothetical protein